MQIEYAVFELV